MPAQPDPPIYLKRSTEFLLATVGGIIVANAYYIHPIISEVSDHFSVSASTIGLVPAFNQIALALGIFLLLPLGDRYSNRRLSILFAAGQTFSLGIMVLADSFTVFLIGSTILGFFTIGPYLLPTYASKRVSPNRLGSVTATLTVGTIFGILVARTGAGVIAQYFEWQLIYIVAVCLMICTTLALPFIMEGRREASAPRGRPNYFKLVGSLFPLLRQYPQVFVSGVIQAFNFGIFLSVWLGLALHLTSPAMGYGVDIVGYLAAFAVVAIFATPRLGQWADKIGPEKARFRLALVQMAGVALLYPLGQNLWLLMIPVIVMNTVGPGIDVAGRMTSLSLAPEIRTRLMTGYIVLMFVGAGFASWAGTASYEWAGWAGSSGLAFALSAGLVGLSLHQARAVLARGAD